MEIQVCRCNVIHEDAVERVRREMPEAGVLEELASFFRVLGDPTRVRIIQALEGGELCVCDLAASLGMSKSAISHQLRTLREARLVRNRREGKEVFYALDDGHIQQVFRQGLEHVGEEGR